MIHQTEFDPHAVEIEEKETEWVFGIPEPLKRKFHEIANQLGHIAGVLQQLDFNLEKKCTKAEVLEALESKADKSSLITTDNIEDKIDELRKETAQARQQEANRTGLKIEALQDVMNKGYQDAIEEAIRPISGSTQEMIEKALLEERAVHEEGRESLERRLSAQVESKAVERFESLSKELKRLDGVVERKTQTMYQEMSSRSDQGLGDLRDQMRRDFEMQMDRKLQALESQITTAIQREAEAVRSTLSMEISNVKMQATQNHTGIEQSRREAQHITARVTDAEKAIQSAPTPDTIRHPVYERVQVLENELRELIGASSHTLTEGIREAQKEAVLKAEKRVMKGPLPLQIHSLEQRQQEIREMLQANITEAVEESELTLRKRLDQGLAAVKQQSEEQHAARQAEIAELVEQLDHLNTDLQQEQEARSAMETPLQMITVQEEQLRALEAALNEETRARKRGVAETVRAIRPLREDLVAEMERKADWAEVRRALWTKVDKTDLPIALSTRPLSPSSSERGRCLSCDLPDARVDFAPKSPNTARRKPRHALAQSMSHVPLSPKPGALSTLTSIGTPPPSSASALFPPTPACTPAPAPGSAHAHVHTPRASFRGPMPRFAPPAEADVPSWRRNLGQGQEEFPLPGSPRAHSQRPMSSDRSHTPMTPGAAPPASPKPLTPRPRFNGPGGSCTRKPLGCGDATMSLSLAPTGQVIGAEAPAGAGHSLTTHPSSASQRAWGHTRQQYALGSPS